MLVISVHVVSRYNQHRLWALDAPGDRRGRCSRHVLESCCAPGRYFVFHELNLLTDRITENRYRNGTLYLVQSL